MIQTAANFLLETVEDKYGRKTSFKVLKEEKPSPNTS